MAEVKEDDFKFPHEIEDEAKGKSAETEDDGGFDVEIEDDTPRKDRGRKPDDDDSGPGGTGKKAGPAFK